jgi:hypothetical protein
MDDKPCGRLRGDAPRVVALVKTDLATRLMPQATCKFRAKPQSGTSWASVAPTGQICPGGWSESPQWVERIAPVGGANRPTTYGGVKRFALPRHALWAALRNSLALIGRQP